MPQIKTPLQYIELFRVIAAAHKQILHTTTAPKFFDNFDLYQASKGVNGNHMVIGWMSEGFLDKKSDNIFKLVTIELWILHNCPINDSGKLLQIYSQTEQIAKDIHSYLIKLRDEVDYTIRPFNYFQSADTKQEPMGPVGTSNAFGTQLQITLGNPENLVFDPTKWDF